MSDKVLKSPQIRFAGYTDNWEESLLGESMMFSNGINAPKENYGKGRKMISVMDILAEESITYEKIRNSVSVDKKIEDKNKVENGDLIFVRSSEVSEEVGWAKAYLQDEYALYSGFSIRGKRTNNYDAYFMELSLNNVNRKHIESKAGGSTRFNVSQEILKSIIILQPTFSEQVEISSFFSVLDHLITLQKQKLGLLKETKKSLLQKMFPREGANVPEIRFAGFTDVWEQIKMKDCFTERSERSAEGELISVTINSGVVKTSDLDRKDNSSLDKSKYKVVKVGDIAYNSMRMWQGASGFSPYDGILSPAYTVITPKENNNPKFFAYNFKRHEMIWTFQINSQGLTSDTWNLKFPALSSIKIAVPSYEEQTKIALFFERVDYQLALHQRELNALKNLKKSLLHQMFV